ncbi:MAG: hypothetical protein K8U57_38560, partial [Planctomycetes bacterium]|nr:hypothetical protein [Planctomycetota bacterium]
VMTKEVVEAAKEIAPGVEGKLVEMLDALQHGAVKVGEQVVKYSPDVADAALWVVRIDGIQSVVLALACIPIAVLCTRWARKFYAYLKEDHALDEPQVLGLAALWCAAGISSLSSAITLLDVWTWIAIIEPKLWLAKKIIATVLK